MIDIQQSHALGENRIREIVQTLADKLAERYEVSNHWEGDSLVFKRSGVDGRIHLLPDAVRITAELGFPLSMMQPMVESEIKRLLSERLA